MVAFPFTGKSRRFVKQHPWIFLWPGLCHLTTAKERACEDQHIFHPCPRATISLQQGRSGGDRFLCSAWRKVLEIPYQSFWVQVPALLLDPASCHAVVTIWSLPPRWADLDEILRSWLQFDPAFSVTGIRGVNKRTLLCSLSAVFAISNMGEPQKSAQPLKTLHMK